MEYKSDYLIDIVVGREPENDRERTIIDRLMWLYDRIPISNLPEFSTGIASEVAKIFDAKFTEYSIMCHRSRWIKSKHKDDREFTIDKKGATIGRPLITIRAMIIRGGI